MVEWGPECLILLLEEDCFSHVVLLHGNTAHKHSTDVSRHTSGTLTFSTEARHIQNTMTPGTESHITNTSSAS